MYSKLVSLLELNRIPTIGNRVYIFILCLLFIWNGPVQAQLFPADDGMLSRDIQVEKYVNGIVTESWPWVDYGLYYSAILQMAYDPVLPPTRWEEIKAEPSRLVVTERSSAGKLLRRFDVSDASYVYTYQTYTDSYLRDIGRLADQIREGVNTIPQTSVTSDKSQLDPITVIIEDQDQKNIRSIAADSPVLSSLVSMIKAGLVGARPFSAVEELNLSQKFQGPGTIQILIRPDQVDLPDEIVLENGQIRVRRSSAMARGYIDKHNWRADAMIQKKLYELWKSRGISTPPKER